MLSRFGKTVALALVLALPIAGCLDSAAPPGPVPIEQTSFASALGVNLTASTKTTNGAYYRDITAGTGSVVATGQSLRVRYTGWLSDGTQFDSNLSAASPFPFTLGTGAVIQGWDEAIPGMRVGGKRQLIIPATLGYGSSGYGPIPGNVVIVFNVEVIANS